MADTAIFDLVAETAMTAAHEFVVQDTSAATVAQAATFALTGGLEYDAQTVTTTDITGAVGKLYGVTIAGLTADRNLTLPSAQVGERLGVHVIDGDASFELILKGAASQTINGGSAATEWSRIFIAGETVVFRCTAANTWIVEYDGRIPCKFHAQPSADLTTTHSAATWTDAGFDSEEYDIGDVYDTSSPFRFTCRRAGKWEFGIVLGPAGSVSDQDNWGAGFGLNNPSVPDRKFLNKSAAAGTVAFTSGVATFDLSTGDTIDAMFLTTQANIGIEGTDVTKSWFVGKELL